MNLKSVSDQILLNETDRLVQQERELLIEILRHLREIERRRLFSALGFKSLFEYAVRRLKYSEDQAGRRISAMRLMKELPEIEEKIEAGSLTLTNLGLVQSLFRQEEKVILFRGRKKWHCSAVLRTQANGRLKKSCLVNQLIPWGLSLIKCAPSPTQRWRLNLSRISP